MLAVGALGCSLADTPVSGDDQAIPANGSKAPSSYAQLVGDFASELAQLAKKCDELQLIEPAATTGQWNVPRQAGRLVFFFSDDVAADHLEKSASERVRQWHERFMALRAKFADHLFVLASEAAHAERGEEAFRLLHEVLREDPGHAEARRILGLSGSVIRRGRPTAASSDHKQFGWKRGRHWSLDSRYFSIESNISPKACSDLAAELERVHEVWRQMFFPVWGKNELVAARFEGRDVDLTTVKRFHVVLMKDREEYQRQLGKSDPNAQLSSGIYLDEQQLSVFYAGNDAQKATWYHEVSHQFFQEYLQAPAGVAKDDNAWMLEAAALFMESLVVHDGYALLGGYDSSNLQFARFRVLGGDFYLPLEQLSSLGRKELQSHKSIRKIYSESAGLGQFFLEGEQGRYRNSFLNALQQVYRGKSDSSSLALACDTPYAQLDAAFKNYLDVTDAQIERTPPYPSLRDLSLRRTHATDASMEAFQKCNQIDWLDLSLTEVGDQGFAQFPASDRMRLLFLEGTKITNVALTHVAEFPQLEELYLTSTAISDDGIEKLTGLRKLKKLDLAGCPVTDASLASLAQLRQLEYLDITGTKITDAALPRLRGSLPKLTIESSVK